MKNFLNTRCAQDTKNSKLRALGVFVFNLVACLRAYTHRQAALSHRVFCGLAFLLLLTGCTLVDPSLRSPSQTVLMETTGYCACGKCCGWERVWWAPWKTVYSSGPSKGKPKKVGITASGTKAKKGTIAADRKIYPYGTVMYIPGYGYGRVEDAGSAIQGVSRIDLFFDTHQQALEWGRQRVPVKVWHQGK